MSATRTFALSEKEYKDFIQFEEEHERRHGRCRATSGGRYSVEFVVTSIGDIKIAKCGACKETKDLSDYESW